MRVQSRPMLCGLCLCLATLPACTDNRVHAHYLAEDSRPPGDFAPTGRRARQHQVIEAIEGAVLVAIYLAAHVFAARAGLPNYPITP